MTKVTSVHLKKFAVLFWYFIGAYLCFETSAYLWQVTTLRRIASSPVSTVAHWSDLYCRSSGCKVTWGSANGFISQRSGNGVPCTMTAFSLFRAPRFSSFTRTGGQLDLSYSRVSPQQFCIGPDGPQPSAMPLVPLAFTWALWVFTKTGGHALFRWLLVASGYMDHPWYLRSRDWTLSRLQKIQSALAAKQSVYNVHLYGMLIEIFWSDGILDAREAKVFEEIVTKMAYGADPAHMGALQAAMKEHNSRKVTFEDDARAFRNEVGANLLALEVALDWLIRAASSSGTIDKKQKSLLFHAANIFEIPQQYVNTQIAEFTAVDEENANEAHGKHEDAGEHFGSSRGFGEREHAAGKPQHPLAWAYRELHCPVGADETEIKKQYRAAVLNYHPDRLRNKGLPPDILESAQRRFLGVQRAYEALTNHPTQAVA